MNSITTQGIKVSVSTEYDVSNSRPDKDYYAFIYRVTIKNERQDTVRLLGRHWFITDANSETREVEGKGVIGEQPILAPGAEHSYSSWCPLATPFGKMSGHYIMQVQHDNDIFHAQVPEFILTAEFLLN